MFQLRGAKQGDDATVPADELPPVLLRIGDLEAASRPVCSVNAHESLIAATTQMLANDYSQLAVFDGSGGVRAVSWESIAKASIAHREATLREASVPVRVVDHDASLLAHVTEIYNIGYVLVRGLRGTITGIVTTADLTLQFANMATPTALIAEVERRLRRRVDEVFTLEEIRAASFKPAKTNSAADLALGAYEHLLKEPLCFARLKWPLDHTLFLAALKTVRNIRNELAHFSTTDPVTDNQLRAIEGLINMLRTVDPRP